MRWTICWIVLLFGVLLSLDFSSAADKDEPPPEEPPDIESEDPGDGRPVQLALETGGHTAPITQVLFTADSKEVITVSLDKTVRIWDVATGQTARVLRPPSSTGSQGRINNAALSPDGKTLAVAALAYRDKNWIGRIYLIRLSDGHIEWSLDRPKDPALAALAFSPDGKHLAAIAPGKPSAINVWSTQTGKVEKQLQSDWPATLAFSPDGQLLAGGFRGKGVSARVWDWASGERIYEVPSEQHRGPRAVAWGQKENRHLLAVCTRDGIAVLKRDGKSFAELWYQKLNGWDYGVSRFLAFTPDGRGLLHIGDEKKRVYLRDTQTGEVVRRFSPPTKAKLDVGAVSADGRWLVVADGFDGYPRDVFVYKTDDEKHLVHHLAGKGQDLEQAVWAFDGKSVAWMTRRPKKGEKTVFPRSLDLTTLELGPEVGDHFDQDQHTRGPLSLKRTEKGVDLLKDGKSFHLLTPGPGNPPHFTFVGDDYAVLSGHHGDIVLYSTSTGGRLRDLHGHTAVVTSLAASAKGRLLSSGADQVLHVWNPQQEKTAPKGQPLRPLLSLFVTDNDWVAWTQEGYYAASPGGEKLIGWMTENGPDRLMSFYPAERFRKKLYRPDVIRWVLEKGSVREALKQANGGVAFRDPPPEVAELLPPTVTLTEVKKINAGKETRIQVTAKATPASKEQPVEELRLLLDGRVHPDAEPVKFKRGKPAEATWVINEVPGHHELKVLARSPDVAGVSDPHPIHADPPEDQKPMLYRLCVGISKYDQDGLRLASPKQDADEIFKALKADCTGKGNLFRDAKGALLLDDKADRKSVLTALEVIHRQAKPGDLVVFYFGGHGVKQKDDFFLLTREADVSKELKGQSLSEEDLRKALGEMPCSVLLMMDACHSSAAVAAFKLKRASDDLTRSLTDDQIAVTVLSAAMAHEIAREGKGHGLFTQALLDGLKADKGLPADPSDRQLYIHDLYGLIFREVRRASEGKQNPFLNMPWTVPPLAVRLVPDKPAGPK